MYVQPTRFNVHAMNIWAIFVHVCTCTSTSIIYFSAVMSLVVSSSTSLVNCCLEKGERERGRKREREKERGRGRGRGDGEGEREGEGERDGKRER